MRDFFPLHALPPHVGLESIEVGGRVTLLESDGFRVAEDGFGTHVQCAARPPLGAWVLVRGHWDGRQLRAERATVLQAPARDLAHADSDLAWGQSGGVTSLQRRHRALRVVRGFFDAEGFTEVETPTVVRSPSLEPYADAPEVLGGDGPRWLQTSPEHHMKRLMSAGMSRIYQLCKAYRRGENGPLHQPEFTTLEWYRAFAGSDDIMRDTEQLVGLVARELCGGPRLPGVDSSVDVTPPWERLTVDEAFRRHASVSVDELLPDKEAYYRVLVESVAPRLGRGRPVFLTHYPAAMASLARLTPGDPSTADRFEAYLDGVELCNGFGELTDPVEQRARFEADRAARVRRSLTAYPIDERFLAALQDGVPPSGGNALGVDRLLMLAFGAKHIAQVVAFSTVRA